MDREKFMEFIRADELHDKLSYDDAIEACLSLLGFSEELTESVRQCINEYENNL